MLRVFFLFALFFASSVPAHAQLGRAAAAARTARGYIVKRRMGDVARARQNALGRAPQRAQARRHSLELHAEVPAPRQRGGEMRVDAAFRGVELVANRTTVRRAFRQNTTAPHSFNVPEVVPGIRQTLVPRRNGALRIRTVISGEIRRDRPGLKRVMQQNRRSILVHYTDLPDGRFQVTFRSAVSQTEQGPRFVERTIEAAPRRTWRRTLLEMNQPAQRIERRLFEVGEDGTPRQIAATMERGRRLTQAAPEHRHLRPSESDHAQAEHVTQRTSGAVVRDAILGRPRPAPAEPTE